MFSMSIFRRFLINISPWRKPQFLEDFPGAISFLFYLYLAVRGTGLNYLTWIRACRLAHVRFTPIQCSAPLACCATDLLSSPGSGPHALLSDHSMAGVCWCVAGEVILQGSEVGSLDFQHCWTTEAQQSIGWTKLKAQQKSGSQDEASYEVRPDIFVASIQFLALTRKEG